MSKSDKADKKKSEEKQAETKSEEKKPETKTQAVPIAVSCTSCGFHSGDTKLEKCTACKKPLIMCY